MFTLGSHSVSPGIELLALGDIAEQPTGASPRLRRHLGRETLLMPPKNDERLSL